MLFRGIVRVVTCITFALLYRLMNGNIANTCGQLPVAAKAELWGFLAHKNTANNPMGKMTCFTAIVSHRFMDVSLVKRRGHFSMTILAAFACGLG